jgi:acyl carrier protein
VWRRIGGFGGLVMIAEQRRTAVDPRISDIVRQLLTKRGVSPDVGPDQDLNEAGLTSVDMVNLMLAVEGEYDIEIPAALLKPDNFRTMRAIEALVASVAG